MNLIFVPIAAAGFLAMESISTPDRCESSASMSWTQTRMHEENGRLDVALACAPFGSHGQIKVQTAVLLCFVSMASSYFGGPVSYCRAAHPVTSRAEQVSRRQEQHGAHTPRGRHVERRLPIGRCRHIQTLLGAVTRLKQRKAEVSFDQASA